jgi:uncharacterized protein YndB with AHSA1/START domain
MKEVVLRVIVERPIREVWDFVTGPDNTPKWIEGIVVEEANETPAKLGTIYRNRGEDDVWTEYKVTELIPGSMFVLSRADGNYHVKYTLNRSEDNNCELEYHEWVERGELDDPFTQDILDKLKTVMETPKH